MKTLFIDLETYSEVPLKTSGTYPYAESDSFEILLFAYSENGGPVKVIDICSGEKLPESLIDALVSPDVTKWAYNASFERVCLSYWVKRHYPEKMKSDFLSPASWRCSMVWAAYMGLPLSLEGAGAVLKLKDQKLADGKALIKYFCSPCAPTKVNGGRTRNLPTHDPAKWTLFKEYNKRDVETEMGIHQRLSGYPVPDRVWDEYILDQQINDRGILIDMNVVEGAIKLDTLSRNELESEMKRLTHLDNPNSVAQMKSWLAEHGMPTDTLGKKVVKELIETAPPELQDVLRLRQQLAKSSIKKYTAMRDCICSDNRARGMFFFYGANRTGRWSGRKIQLQNLPQNHIADLAGARSLVEAKDYDAVKLLYEDVPDALSQLIRTAFVPKDGCRFVVADFSAIEARVLSHLAGEEWRSEVFSSGGDIYCQSASAMFSVPVVKHGINGELRQKGKIAELACIAEGSLVLTDRGLVPIQDVTLEDRLWDGESWVSHEGVVYRGEREVITYDGLTATADHLVWVQGKPWPIQFGDAASSGARLVKTGDSRREIRLGENNISGEKVDYKSKSSVCTNTVHRLRIHTMDISRQPKKRQIQRLSEMLSAITNSKVAGQAAHNSKAALPESESSGLLKLWRERHYIRLSKRARGRTLSNRTVRYSGSFFGNRPNRHKRELCTRKSQICRAFSKLYKSAKECLIRVLTGILALLPSGSNQEAVCWQEPRRDNTRCAACSCDEKNQLEDNKRTARLYDIRNAGPHHRFTVSDCLVHNCGYGGSVGALKAMGALEMGLDESELQPLVNSWREANPHIVQLWWDVDRAVKKAVKEKCTTEVKGIKFICKSGMLFIELPSGRRLSYIKPKIGENKYGGECVTYEGTGTAKKWERLESYGPKFVENITQAISRDILAEAMLRLSAYDIVAHVHDEVIIEASTEDSMQDICELMSRTPYWIKGLNLRADGYECPFYMKD